MTIPPSELARMRQTYGQRESHLAGSDLYSLSNPAYLFTIQQRQRSILRLLGRNGMMPLKDKDILEVGCGAGGVLLELLSYGATAKRLHGTDLLTERVRVAHELLPHVAVNTADGQRLPYANCSFDLLLQFTMFSSIGDEPICYTVAKEMLRVLKPGGMILSYDFWVNPANNETRGITPQQLRRYFPDCSLDLDRITLAPPLARRLVPVTWTGSQLLERLRVFNTHYLVGIRPQARS